eukprot:1916276-Rhodomonas_salina.3
MLTFVLKELRKPPILSHRLMLVPPYALADPQADSGGYRHRQYQIDILLPGSTIHEVIPQPVCLFDDWAGHTLCQYRTSHRQLAAYASSHTLPQYRALHSTQLGSYLMVASLNECGRYKPGSAIRYPSNGHRKPSVAPYAISVPKIA